MYSCTRHLFFSGLTALLAASTAFAQVDWDYEWTDATPFNNAEPAWVTTVTNSGKLNDHTSGEPARFTTNSITDIVTAAQSNGFEPSTGNGKTVEFRIRVESQLGAAGAGGIYAYGSVANKRFAVIVTTTGVRFLNGAPEYKMDTSKFNTFRLIFDDAGNGGAFLYVNGGTVPVLSKSVGGSTGGTNLLWIGDVTNGDQIGGVTEWEYVRWTNKGQFEPDSESGP